MMPRIVVIGGGFSGMAAACRLANEGHRTLVIERAPRLGGRAASALDPETGEVIDYGHHVLLACCTAARGFLLRIGATDCVRFQPELRIPIRCDGRTSFLRSSLLPGPLHLLPSLLAYRPLALAQRFRALPAGLALLAGGRRSSDAFGPWLAAHGQDAGAIDRLWGPITIATLNAPAGRVSTTAAAKVFRDGFLVPGGANMGLFTQPLSEIFDRARRYVEARDGEIRTGVGVSAIRTDASRVVGVELADGKAIDADAVIAAVPRDVLAPLVPSASPAATAVDRAAGLEWAPIVDVHLWFDRPVLDEAFVIAVDAPIQAVFDIDRLHGRAGPETHIVVSQSAATDWMPRSPGEIAAIALDGMRELFPRVCDAACVRRRVIKHRRATFVPTPGSDALRPRTATAIDGLFLAGDWTATGWPSTIEGAIRSGIAAASRVEWLVERSNESAA